MNAIDVSFFIKYLTNRDLQRRDNDWSAFKIRQFVKNEPINGRFSVTVGGQVRTFANKDKADFMAILYRVLAKKLAADVAGEFSIVPIPNSTAVVSSKGTFETLRLANEIAALIRARAKVVPALRWKTAKKPSHKDGGRNSQEFYENLSVVSKVSGPVVVFDDFITTGSQIKASCRRLLEAKCDIRSALVIARVVHEYVDPVFGWDTWTVPTIDPPIDWDALLE